MSRYQYFQTADTITVEIYSPDASITTTPNSIHITSKDATTNIQLAYPVKENVTIDKGKKKQSIVLHKVDHQLWSTLEKTSQPQHTQQAQVTQQVQQPQTTLTNSYHKWDGITTEEKEKEGGDPNDFFKTLFKDASPEAQKAMMKSYSESGGTVLSTNWDEVKQKKTEVKPPAGMVPKKFEV